VEKKEEGVKVFAGNLAFATTDEGLREFFAPVKDDIITATIVQRYGRSSGYGFVTVKTHEVAEKAVQELDKQELDGRTVIVEVARTTEAKDSAKKERQSTKRKASRRGSKAVQGEVTEAEADGQTGTPARIDDAGATTEGEGRPKKKKAPRKKKAKTPAVDSDAETTEKLEKLDVNGTEKREKAPRKPRAPREPRAKREPGEAPAGEPSKSVLFVANLAFSVDEAQLTEFFTNAGVNVTTARVVRRRWGTPRKSKGYGFVDVGDEAEQQKAIGLTDGKTIADREISVKVAVDAKHIDEAVDNAEGTENPENPSVHNTAQFPVVPVMAQ